MMNTQQINVVYKWTAKPGKANELQSIYREVEKQMKENEPGAIKVSCFFNEDTGNLLIHDQFEDSAALGLHLSTTAAGHFPALLQIADPGPFFFCGEVPQPLQEAAVGMGLDATFAPRTFGFERVLQD